MAFRPLNFKLLSNTKGTKAYTLYKYILKHDYDISEMKFQEDEVSDAKWATWEEINTLVKNGEFIKHRWEFVNKFLKVELEEAK